MRRFWAKVNKNGPTVRPELTPCWVWTASCFKDGRPAFWDGKRMRIAAQFSLEVSLGRKLRPGLESCHECDNPKCVRPEHLHEGTHLQNMQEMEQRGRRINAAARTIQVNNTSGYRGVTWNSARCKWQASASFNNKRKYLGLFDDPKEASDAYEAAVKAPTSR